jgi:hypothetical protein
MTDIPTYEEREQAYSDDELAEARAVAGPEGED